MESLMEVAIQPGVGPECNKVDGTPREDCGNENISSFANTSGSKLETDSAEATVSSVEVPLDTIGTETSIPAALIMCSDAAKVTNTSEFCTDLVSTECGQTDDLNQKLDCFAAAITATKESNLCDESSLCEVEPTDILTSCPPGPSAVSDSSPSITEATSASIPTIILENSSTSAPQISSPEDPYTPEMEAALAADLAYVNKKLVTDPFFIFLRSHPPEYFITSYSYFPNDDLPSETVPFSTHVNLENRENEGLENRENKGLQNQLSCFKTTPTKAGVKKDVRRKLNIVTEKCSANSTKRGEGSKNNGSGVLRDISTLHQFRNRIANRNQVRSYGRFGVKDKNEVTSKENDCSVENHNSVVKSYLYSNLSSDEKFDLFLKSTPHPNRLTFLPLSDDSEDDTLKKKQDPYQLDPNTGHRKNKFKQAFKRKIVSKAAGPTYGKKVKDQYEIKYHENKHRSNFIDTTNTKNNKPKNGRKIKKKNFSRKHPNIIDTTDYVQDGGVIEDDSDTEMQDDVMKSGFSGYSSMFFDSPNQPILKNVKMSTVQDTSPSASSQLGIECPLCYRMFPSNEIEVHAANCQ